eukprot:Rhum_TRINITY_DN14793_c14_g1::Rhum_TRINITY_DN14793_c14_g1_i1::g.117499::m.117499
MSRSGEDGYDSRSVGLFFFFFFCVFACLRFFCSLCIVGCVYVFPWKRVDCHCRWYAAAAARSACGRFAYVLWNRSFPHADERAPKARDRSLLCTDAGTAWPVTPSRKRCSSRGAKSLTADLTVSGSPARRRVPAYSSTRRTVPDTRSSAASEPPRSASRCVSSPSSTSPTAPVKAPHSIASVRCISTLTSRFTHITCSSAYDAPARAPALPSATPGIDSAMERHDGGSGSFSIRKTADVTPSSAGSPTTSPDEPRPPRDTCAGSVVCSAARCASATTRATAASSMCSCTVAYSFGHVSTKTWNSFRAPPPRGSAVAPFSIRSRRSCRWRAGSVARRCSSTPSMPSVFTRRTAASAAAEKAPPLTPVPAAAAMLSASAAFASTALNRKRKRRSRGVRSLFFCAGFAGFFSPSFGAGAGSATAELSSASDDSSRAAISSSVLRTLRCVKKRRRPLSSAFRRRESFCITLSRCFCSSSSDRPSCCITSSTAASSTGLSQCSIPRTSSRRSITRSTVDAARPFAALLSAFARFAGGGAAPSASAEAAAAVAAADFFAILRRRFLTSCTSPAIGGTAKAAAPVPGSR